MKPALQKLLPHVEDAEENIFIFPFLKNILSEEEIESLEKKGVFIKMRDLEKISCESCISGEFVNVRINEKGRIYYTCGSDGSRQYIDPKKLRQWKFNKKHLPKKDSTPIKRLIEKDERGNFFYDGKRIEMARETLYYKLLDILYEKNDQSGFVSYDEIEKGFVTRGENPAGELEKVVKRISNSSSKSNGLFRSATINGKPLCNETLSGEKLIEPRRGEGLIFHNIPM